MGITATVTKCPENTSGLPTIALTGALAPGRNRYALPHRRPRALEPDEGLLWHEFKEGSEWAFTCIYKKYIVSLYRYGKRITPDKQLIEDSVHDFFVDLWRNRGSIGHARSVKYYLFKGLKRKIIKNLIIKRRLPGHEKLAEDYDFEMTSSHEYEIIAGQVSAEQKKRLFTAIDKLSKRQKEAVSLRFYKGLTYQQVATMLSISAKSTYTLIYRAIDVLKENIAVL